MKNKNEITLEELMPIVSKSKLKIPCEDQVTSLRISQKLSKLGLPQRGYFMWVFRYKTWVLWDETCVSEYSTGAETKRVYAYTVTELGEMFNKIGTELMLKAYGEVFNFKGTQVIGDFGVINLMRKPDMAAKMLIYLIENKLV